jgi:hypothetical protein
MLVEVLWPIHARQSTTIVHGRNLECGGTLACDHECQRTQESDKGEMSNSDMRSTYSIKACSSLDVRYCCLAAFVKVCCKRGATTCIYLVSTAKQQSDALWSYHV